MKKVREKMFEKLEKEDTSIYVIFSLTIQLGWAILSSYLIKH